MGVSGFCVPGWFGRRRRMLPLWMLGAVAPPVHYDAIDRRRPAAVGRSRQLREKAGPVPHLPEDGKVVSFGPRSTTATEVASGSPLLVDVEFGRGRRLYALSQGVGSGGLNADRSWTPHSRQVEGRPHQPDERPGG
jgi:hypothetical protein